MRHLSCRRVCGNHRNLRTWPCLHFMQLGLMLCGIIMKPLHWEGFSCSPLHSSLCPYFVCPTNISESMLVYAASLHMHNRLPVSFPHVLYAINAVCGTVLCVIYLSGSHVIQVWCWSHPHTGVSLTRGALPVVEDPSEAPDPKYVHLSLVPRSPTQPFVSCSKWKLDRVL